MATNTELRDKLATQIGKLLDAEGVEEYTEADGRSIRKASLGKLVEAHTEFDNRVNASSGPRTQGVTFKK